jgi:hypothetical protein
MLPPRKLGNRPIYGTRRAFATYNVVNALLAGSGTRGWDGIVGHPADADSGLCASDALKVKYL